MSRSAEFHSGRAPQAGDPVTLHDGSQGQLWSPSSTPNTWHAVGDGGTAHTYNAKTGSSYPAENTGMALANHKARINQKYEKWGGGSSAGRAFQVNQTDIKQLSAKRRKKAV